MGHLPKIMFSAIVFQNGTSEFAITRSETLDSCPESYMGSGMPRKTLIFCFSFDVSW